MSSRDLRIGIVGATGIVGAELIFLLETRGTPISELHLFASEKSGGKSIEAWGKSFSVKKLEKSALQNLDYMFFCSTEEISLEFIPTAAANGICCIDNSSAFRERSDVPLVVPEINHGDLANHGNVIANPNCSTIIALMAIFPLHTAFGLRGFCASTYQAVSGVGRGGMEALRLDNSGDFTLSREIFGEQILHNAIPKIGKFLPNGYSTEEMKMLNESRKILSLPELAVSSTCVRIPVARAHSMSIIAQFNLKPTLELVEDILAESEFVDFYSGDSFPSPLRQSNADSIGVGRLRADSFLENALSMWVVGDQIRKGAALNAVQIMEYIESVGH
ncbi:MAG: aspartate-semialdehyde dehydrogenase [Puniceicoccales bacterium]|nr:aspartate-semialdehyde dehydrogenase [Puniceicoccales bacterium]